MAIKSVNHRFLDLQSPVAGRFAIGLRCKLRQMLKLRIASRDM